jgi:hypothetical protein
MEELYDLYYELDQELFDVMCNENYKIANENDKATFPLFIEPTGKYLSADIKLMIFGQETNSWYGVYGDKKDKKTKDVAWILGKYEDFFSGTETSYNSPFWQGTKNIINGLRSKFDSNKTVEFLWNNIVKMGYAGRNVKPHFPHKFYDDINIIKKYLNPLIPMEIDILKPDFIIFFTGPDYDRVIDDIFLAPCRKAIEGFTKRELCEIMIPNVKRSFRTYHPQYLYRNTTRHKNDFFEVIINEIYKSL